MSQLSLYFGKEYQHTHGIRLSRMRISLMWGKVKTIKHGCVSQRHEIVKIKSTTPLEVPPVLQCGN